MRKGLRSAAALAGIDAANHAIVTERREIFTIESLLAVLRDFYR